MYKDFFFRKFRQIINFWYFFIYFSSFVVFGWKFGVCKSIRKMSRIGGCASVPIVPGRCYKFRATWCTTGRIGRFTTGTWIPGRPGLARYRWCFTLKISQNIIIEFARASNSRPDYWLRCRQPMKYLETDHHQLARPSWVTVNLGSLSVPIQ